MGRKYSPGPWDPEVNRKQRWTRLFRPRTPTHSHSERVKRDFSLFRQKKSYQLLTTATNQQLRQFHQKQHQQRQLQQYGATPEPASGTAATPEASPTTPADPEGSGDLETTATTETTAPAAPTNLKQASAAARLDHHQQQQLQH
jgi:hypothetical protein